MQIVIQIKPGASIARIEALNTFLEDMRYDSIPRQGCMPFGDVIESIDAEGLK